MLVNEINTTIGIRSRKTMDKPSTLVSTESGKPTQDLTKLYVVMSRNLLLIVEKELTKLYVVNQR